MRRLIALVLATALMLGVGVPAAYAGTGTNVALGLASFAVFNQLVRPLLQPRRAYAARVVETRATGRGAAYLAIKGIRRGANSVRSPSVFQRTLRPSLNDPPVRESLRRASRALTRWRAITTAIFVRPSAAFSSRRARLSLVPPNF